MLNMADLLKPRVLGDMIEIINIVLGRHGNKDTKRRQDDCRTDRKNKRNNVSMQMNIIVFNFVQRNKNSNLITVTHRETGYYSYVCINKL